MTMWDAFHDQLVSQEGVRPLVEGMQKFEETQGSQRHRRGRTGIDADEAISTARSSCKTAIHLECKNCLVI